MHTNFPIRSYSIFGPVKTDKKRFQVVILYDQNTFLERQSFLADVTKIFKPRKKNTTAKALRKESLNAIFSRRWSVKFNLSRVKLFFTEAIQLKSHGNSAITKIRLTVMTNSGKAENWKRRKVRKLETRADWILKESREWE